MCHNAPVSILTYLFGMSGSIYLFNQNYIVESIFFIWVIQMQLIEFFLWNNQNCNSDNINVSKLGLVINHLEPIILWIAILLYSSKTLPNYINLFMLVFIYFTINYTTYSIEKQNCTLVTEQTKPHLYWSWNNQKGSIEYYQLFIVALNLLCFFGLENGITSAMIMNVGYTISYILYKDKNTVGAMWCYYAALAPWFLPKIYEIFN